MHLSVHGTAPPLSAASVRPRTVVECLLVVNWVHSAVDILHSRWLQFKRTRVTERGKRDLDLQNVIHDWNLRMKGWSFNYYRLYIHICIYTHTSICIYMYIYVRVLHLCWYDDLSSWLDKSAWQVITCQVIWRRARGQVDKSTCQLVKLTSFWSGTCHRKWNLSPTKKNCRRQPAKKNENR